MAILCSSLVGAAAMTATPGSVLGEMLHLAAHFLTPANICISSISHQSTNLKTSVQLRNSLSSAVGGRNRMGLVMGGIGKVDGH